VDILASRPQALRYAEHDRSRAVIRKILVVVDPTTREQAALEKAVRIATSCGASLELYICDVEQSIPESWTGGARAEEFRGLMRERHLQELEFLARPLRKRGLDVSTVAEWHPPLEEGIGHHVIRTAPDLVIKETHWHAAMPRVSLTRTDWILIRQIPAPLLLVRRTPWPSAPRVVVSVDPCHPADHPRALDQALIESGRSLANALTAEMEVVHVLQNPPHLPRDTVAPEVKKSYQERAAAAVTQLAERAGACVRFANGALDAGIVTLVGQTQPSILVMGAVARPRWVHSAASGTAAQILERISCDLLIVKPPGFVSPLLVTDD
jgi:universal stress protein E